MGNSITTMIAVNGVPNCPSCGHSLCKTMTWMYDNPPLCKKCFHDLDGWKEKPYGYNSLWWDMAVKEIERLDPLSYESLAAFLACIVKKHVVKNG